MRYFKIGKIVIDKEHDKAISNVNGEFVPNAKEYFDRIGNGEIIFDAPMFDYFHLQSFASPEEWEWKLQDAHGFIGEYPTGGGWYISDRFKNLLDKFSIASHHYYATKLLYKGEKYDYWIFRYSVEPSKNVDFAKSIFYVKETNELVEEIPSWDEFLLIRRKYRKELSKTLVLKKGVYHTYFDFAYNIIEGDLLVSEKLKTAIQEAGLVGLEFKEFDYEVEFSNPV